jgi:hypothetical protein
MLQLPNPAGDPDPVTGRILELVRSGKTFEQIMKEHSDLRGPDLYRARKFIVAMIFEERPETVLRSLNQDAGRTLSAASSKTSKDDPEFAHGLASYHLKISLDNVKPKIWRRLVVPGHIRLDLLHDVFQIVMGWQDMHLHTFEIGGRRFSEKPEEDFEGDEEHHYRLDSLIQSSPRSFAYEYDFGDGWWHTITVQEIVEFEPNMTVFPKCVGGKNACPPEDCGGPYTYTDTLKTLRSVGRNRKTKPRHKSRFDPCRFDVEHVNLELAKHLRWSRHRWGAPVFGIF